MTSPRALDAFLRDVYGYWAAGGLFALASSAWGRVLMLVCVGLVPLALASIDFHELSTCRSRGACPASASAYWRHPTATAPQVVGLVFFCATLPVSAALGWAATGAVRRGLVLQCLVRDWAGVPDEELGLRGWDGLLRALGEAAAAEAAGEGGGDTRAGGLYQDAVDKDARAAHELQSLRRAAALRRLPSDVQAIVAQLARSVAPPELSVAPRGPLSRAEVLPRDSSAQPTVVSQPAPLAAAVPPAASSSSMLGLPFAGLTMPATPGGAAALGPALTAPWDAGSIAPALSAPPPLPGPSPPPRQPSLAESTWLPLPPLASSAAGPSLAAGAGGERDGAPPPPPLAQLLRPRDVAARVLRLESFLVALACAGELGEVSALRIPPPGPGIAMVAARLQGTAASVAACCCSRGWRPAGSGGGAGEASRLLLPALAAPTPVAAPPPPPPLVVSLPFTLSLQWALQTLVLAPLVSSRGTLRPAALSPAGVRALQARCRWAGALGLAAAPVTLPLAALWVGLRQAEDALAARDYFGPRTWAPLAALLFAEHGELPHVVAARLAAAREPAQRFLDAFPSPAASALGRGAAFVAAALLALLAAVGAADEDALLFVTLGGRSLWFYVAVLGAVLAAARAATQPAAPAPPGTPAAPLGRLAALSAALRFTPHAWGAGSAAWLLSARDEVSRLFLPRVAVLAAEALGAVTTPLALLASVPARVPAIVEFVRHNTVYEPGIGAVCAPSALSAAPPDEQQARGSGLASSLDLASFLRRGPSGGGGRDGGIAAVRRDRLARSLASLVEQHPCEARAAASEAGARRGSRPAGNAGDGGGASRIDTLLSRIPALDERSSEDEEDSDANEQINDGAVTGGGGGSGDDLDAVGAAMEAAMRVGGSTSVWGGLRADGGPPRDAALWAPRSQPPAASLLPPGYAELAEDRRLHADAGRAAANDLALLVGAGGAAAHL